MLSKSQKIFLNINRDRQFIIVGTSSLVYNGLMYGTIGGEVLNLHVPIRCFDTLNLASVKLQYYHFSGFDYCKRFMYSDNLWLPSAERALIDTIEFMDNYWIEGQLIESLQDYICNHKDLSALYEVAEYYNVSSEKVNYWIKEALNCGSISIG